MITLLATKAMDQFTFNALVIGGLFAGMCAIYAVWFIVVMSAKRQPQDEYDKQDKKNES